MVKELLGFESTHHSLTLYGYSKEALERKNKEAAPFKK
jgi:hypothetical protein